jgi:hypothetical protein
MTDWREKFMLKALRLVRILRLEHLILASERTYSFTDYFKGLEKVEIVRKIFGEKTGEVLRNLKVEFTPIGGYMWIDGSDGHLVVSAQYLNKGDKVDIYLDLIHELVHVRQLMEGKDLFDSRYDYVERPTEVEAYRYAVQEARRLGLGGEEICEYLKTEWMSNEDLKRLARTLNVKCKR